MSTATPPLDAGPLTGVRVLETGTLIAGPFCGQLLGDFGAEVVKIEDPAGGDPMRTWRTDAQGRVLWWPIIARNKRSVTCDLRRSKGQDILRSLAAQADVLVENFRPGTLERWGLGPEDLHRVNPRLVVVRVTGYGQDGPYAHRAGFGSIGEAMGGIRHLTGDPDRPPSRTGVSLGDSLAGTFAAFGAVLALHARTSTGRGQVVDSAIYEAVLALMESIVPEWEISGELRGRSGPVLTGVAPSNVYPTADGADVLIAANRDTVFTRLCTVMERNDLLDDYRFARHEARGRHAEELDAVIADWSRTMPTADVLDRLHAAGVPAGQAYTAKDMVTDPHFAARRAIVRLAHDTIGDFPMQNVAPRLSATPGSIRRLGPALGEDTDDILGTVLGWSPDKIAGLRREGIV